MLTILKKILIKGNNSPGTIIFYFPLTTPTEKIIIKMVPGKLFFPVSHCKTLYSYRLKTYRKAVFSFPCMVPIDCHKRIFYNLKALNDITFPFFDVPCYLNPSCPKPKYNISRIQMKNFPTKVEHLPNQNIVVTNLNAVVTKIKRCRHQTKTISLPT